MTPNNLRTLFDLCAQVVTLLTVVVFLAIPAGFVAAAAGVPKILNYQGRLMDSSGVLLGGTGTPYCFKFSIYDDATVGSGSKLWPSSAPSVMTATVRNGVFSVGVGDTGIGGDVLDFDFQSTDTAFLNVEVATKVGATCAPGDGAESFETLSPRNRIESAGYAVNASTVGGFTPAQQATGNQIPVLSSNRLVLGGIGAGISATSSNVLTLQGSGATGNINFFNGSNTLTSSGDFTLAGLLSSDRIVFVSGTSTHFFSGSIAANSAAFGATATSSFSTAGELTLAGSFNGPLQAQAGVVSATSTIGVTYGGTGISTVPTFGQLLLGTAAGGYSLAATSTLGLPTFASLASYLSLAAWYATTTDALAEGSTNRYFTVDRVAAVLAGTTTTALAEGTNLYFTTARATTSFVGNLAATTSVNSITTLNNLVLPASQLAGFGVPFYQFFAATTTDALAQGSINRYYATSLFAADLAATTTDALAEGTTNLYYTTARAQANFVSNLAATTSVSSITALPNLSVTASQVSDFSDTVNAFVGASTTVVKTYTPNTFVGTQTFQNASTTNISAVYASSTNLVAGTASTTNLAITSLANSILKVNTLGQVGAASAGVDYLAPAALSAYLALTDWYSTTTSDIQEGSNLYFTTARATTSFVGNLAATTSVSSITALPNLSLSALQLTGFGVPFYQFFNSTTTDALAEGSINKYYNNSLVQAFIHASSTIPKTYTANVFTAAQTFGTITATNATTTSLFSPFASILNGEVGVLRATTSALLASTTAQGRFIAGNIVSTSTATSTFAGPLSVGIANSSYQVSILGSTTAPTSATGTAVLAVSNDNNTLSSGTNVLRLNLRTAYGTACVTGTTCPRFIEYFAGVGAGNDTGGRGVGSLRLSTAGTGITQTSGSADFAEYMQLNSAASTGDLVSLNAQGEYQRAVAGQSLVGVISENPAFVGNANIEGNANAYIVGFAGVVPTTVSTANGAINAGDLIAASTTPGVGVKLVNSGYALGQALQSYSGAGNGTINVLVMPKYVDAAVVLESYGGTQGGVSGYWDLSTTTGQVSLASTTYSLVVNKLSLTNASTTNISATYASSTQGFFGSLSVGNLSGILKATGGAVSTALVGLASDVSGILGIANGGTGTSTAPTYGQVLLGNAVGGYDLVATSSLGITSAAWGNITGTLSNQTDLQNALNAKLSLTDWYSTTTSDIAEGSNLYFTTDRVATVIAGTTTTALAEGTNLYFTTARATTSFVSNLAATTSVASITTLPNLSLAATQLSGFGIPFFQYFAATTTDALTQGTTNKYYSSALFAADLAATTSVNSIIALNNLVITAAQVSDFANGINAYIAASTTIPKTYTSNTFAGTQTFQNASTTNISATYASSTNLVTGNATTTNLAVASLSNSLLKVNALGQVGAASAGVDFVAPGSLSNYLLLADWYSTTTSDIQEGSNLYFTTARATTSFVSNLAATTSVASITTLSNLSITNAQVSDFASGVNTFVGSSSTLPKTYAANAFTALQQFAAGASSTAQSALDYVAVGRTATTTIRGEANATSTFAGGVEAGALNVISTVASSTFANGINLAQGCFAVNGTCIGAGGGGGSGVIVNIQAFTSSGTYTPSPGATSAQVIVTGAGGGGGGILGTDTTNETVAGGGGAGATSIDYVDLTNVTTVSVTVGAGGTAGAATGGTGGTGGTSSFGSFAAADGGVGGVGSAVNATGCAATGAIGAGGAGGSASLGAINIPGGAGSVGSCLAEITNGGDGAASYWGGGGSGAVDTNGNGAVVGNSAVVYGAGGGGAAEEDATTGATGGAGAGGIVVVYEYGPHTGVTAVDDGGTGTSTAPAYGQVLVGNALGGYDLVATSSLGITSGSSFDYLFPGNATTTKIDFNGGLSASYASTTGISSGYASSTQGFFGSLSVGSLSGVLRATAGVISTGLVNLASEVSGVLGVANGGTGWANIQANTLLTGNGAGAVATTSIGSSLQLSGGTLSLNLSNPNVWNGLQTFSNSSTTIISAYRAYFGGTATTTIDGAGNVVVGGSLTSTAGDTTLASTSATRIAAAHATTTNATSTNAYADSLVAAGATSTRLYVSSSFMGAGLTTCSASGDKLLWNSATGQFTCGVDAGGVGSGVTSLGAAGQGQTGATQTFATSSDTNIGLTITSLANTHTFTTIWNGILSVARGGTGWGNIQAGTLLTGNGTGALATTTIGSSLQISGSTLSLNLANANIWTGLQTFNTASTTLLETVTQWARTIQSTSTNALALRTNLTATAGLTLGSTSTPQMLALDTVNNRTTIGTGGGTPTLFVIDTKNTAGDPSGVDGASYYNSNSGLWRCYAGGTWRTCGGQAASSTGAVQLSGSDGGLGGTANFAWSFLTNGLTIKATSSAQTTDLLTFASTTGNAMFAVSSRGVLELATTTDPSAAASGQLNIYAKDVAGRVLPKWVGPSGVDTPFQPAFFGNNVSMWFPNTGATVSVAMGTSWTARNSGTAAAQTTPAIASTNLYTSMKRGLFSTGTTATGSSGTQSSQTLVWRGNAAGLGGFFYFARVGVDSTYRTDVQMMNGVSALNAALTGQPSAQNNSIILGKDSGDTTWQIITRDGATANKVDTGLTIASGQILDFYIFARPNDTKVTVRVVQQTTSGAVVVVDNLDITNNLPVNTTFLYAHHQIRSTTGTATAGFALNRIYVETDI